MSHDVKCAAQKMLKQIPKNYTHLNLFSYSNEF